MWIKEEIKNLVRVRDTSEKRHGMLCMDRNERTLAFNNDILSKIKNKITSETLTNYPEIELLYNNMAKYLNIEACNLIFHTGSDLVIKSIYETYISKGDKILLQKPAYAMYGVYAEMFQADVIVQKYEEDMKFDMENYLEKLIAEKPKMVVLENPNGSVGNGYSHQQVEKLIIAADRRNTLVVIDEAYIDFSGGSVIDLIEKYNNLIVVRTMSKAWGLAGLRIGYAVSCKENINDLFQVKPMHQLTSFSIIAAQVLIENNNVISDYVEEMNKVRKYVETELNSKGIATTDSVVHFVTAELGKIMDIDRFRRFLYERNYLIRRPFETPELSAWVRIGLLPMDQMKNFMKLLDVYMEENLR